MVVLVTCKNEQGPIENVGSRVFTKIYINFSDVQGQITLQSMVGSGQILNSSETLWMSSSPAEMNKI